MSRELRSIIYRYGLAFILFIAVIAVALLLRSINYQINLTILVVIGLVAASWWGGRGPGFVFSALVILSTLLLNDAPAGQPAASLIFSAISVLAILLLIVILISGRRITERRLRDQTDLLSITLSSIADAVIATDAEGRIGFINPTAARLTGCSPAAVIGQPLADIYQIVDETTGIEVADLFKTIKQDGKVVSFSGEMSLIDCDGARVPISDTAAPIVDSSGAFRGAVVVFQDVSERRNSENALRESEARTRQSQKLEAIGTLTGGIAHDFNNLLTAILGFAQLSMHQVPSKDPVYQNLIRVEQAANKGAALTQKLLAFSKRQHLDRRIMSLNDSIAEILKLLERVIGENIDVSFLPEQGLAAVSADPAQMELVIMNLSINARDAMPRGGRLTIETHNISVDEHYCRQYPYFTPGTYAEIDVSDTGTGMDPEVMNKIFEPFFTTKEVNKGTGLGLSMVYGIVKQHGGQINVYSEVGHGSTFKIFLPAVDAEVTKEVKVTQPTLIGGRETILVAEDEASLRMLSEEVLTSLGYTVRMAENGKEAIEIFKQDPTAIDLLLFDVVMPVMGGADAYLKIREAGGDRVPIIFMTGYSAEVLDNPYAESNKFDIGGARVIQKPYSLDALGRTVREALDHDGR